MTKIYSSIACNLDANILKTALPLFHTEKVQAIEWSFDSLFKVRNIPDWFIDLLKEFGAADRLIGHGVFFSLFSGKWSEEQNRWLAHLKKVSHNFNFDHITEHFGFMTGENFHKGAPISLPFTEKILAIGQDRLKRIYEACECPVGLENLAFAYTLDEVERHGEFLNQLMESVNGFIILDLHNLFCQLHNFEKNFEDIIKLYPLDRVREIHISGGSWEDSSLEPNKKVRRDTHDDAVPLEVFQLLEKAIPLCPNLKYVVLEQLGTGLSTESEQQQYQKDFFQMDQIVESYNDVTDSKSTQHNFANNFLPAIPFDLGEPLQDEKLHQEQIQLSQILENTSDYTTAKTALLNSSLANSRWNVESWNPVMLETAIAIAQKWQ